MEFGDDADIAEEYCITAGGVQGGTYHSAASTYAWRDCHAVVFNTFRPFMNCPSAYLNSLISLTALFDSFVA